MLAINESQANSFIDDYPILNQVFLSMTIIRLVLVMINFHRIQIDSKIAFKTFELLINIVTSKLSQDKAFS